MAFHTRRYPLHRVLHGSVRQFQQRLVISTHRWLSVAKQQLYRVGIPVVLQGLLGYGTALANPQTNAVPVTHALSHMDAIPAESLTGDHRADLTINGYRIQGNTLLAEEELTRATLAYTGKHRSLLDIEMAVEALRNAYEAKGFPIVRVYAPPQTTDDGILTIQVVEGRIRDVSIRDNLHHDNANIRRALPSVREGARPNTADILRDLAAANEQPARFASVNFQRTETPGAVDAVIRVRDEQPLKLSLSIDNSGYAITGKHRIQAGLRHSNLFNRDHMILVQAGTFDRFNTGYVAAVTYRIPLYGQARWIEWQAVHTDVNSVFNPGPGDTRFNGQGQLFGLRILQNLSSQGDWQQRASVAIDSKRYKNGCSGSVQGDCGSIAALPLTVAWSATWNPELQSFNAQVSHSRNLTAIQPGEVAQYDALNADRSWSVWRASTQYRRTWPGDMQASITLAGQYTRDRLIPAEQSGLGGASTIRGYAERSLTGGRSAVVNLEVLSPRIGVRLDERLDLRALLFWDAGHTGDAHVARHANPGTPNLSKAGRTLTSVGVGLRGQWGRSVSVRADWGVAGKSLRSTGMPDMQRDKGDVFAHVALSFFY